MILFYTSLLLYIYSAFRQRLWMQ